MLKYNNYGGQAWCRDLIVNQLQQSYMDECVDPNCHGIFQSAFVVCLYGTFLRDLGFNRC